MGFDRRGWTSRATSGRSSSPPPDDLERALRRRHPRDAAVPARWPSRPPSSSREGGHDHRRARRVVPAGHGGDELPQRAREDVGRGRGDRPRRPSVCATSTTPACTSWAATTTAARSGSAGAARRTCLPPYTELVRFDAGERLTGRRAARGRPRAAAASPRAAPAAEPVRALRRPARATTCPGCSTATPRRLPRLRVRDRPDGRRGLRARRRAPRLAARRSGRRRPSRRWREIVDGCKMLSFKLARRRAFDPRPLRRAGSPAPGAGAGPAATSLA